MLREAYGALVWTKGRRRVTAGTRGRDQDCGTPVEMAAEHVGVGEEDTEEEVLYFGKGFERITDSALHDRLISQYTCCEAKAPLTVSLYILEKCSGIGEWSVQLDDSS